MGARGKLRRLEGGRVAFMCPGCRELHQVAVAGDARPAWDFNGDFDRPTFSPSILVRGSRPITDDEHRRIMAGEAIKSEPTVCHSFVRDGQIQFLSDCTHDLGGQTVELPSMEEPL